MDRHRKLKLVAESMTESYSNERYARLQEENQSCDSGQQSHTHSLEHSSINSGECGIGGNTAGPDGSCTVNINRDLLFTEDILQHERGAYIRGVINSAFEHFTPCHHHAERICSKTNNVSTLPHLQHHDPHRHNPGGEHHHQARSVPFSVGMKGNNDSQYDFSSSTNLSSNMSSFSANQKTNNILKHFKNFFTPDFDDDDNYSADSIYENSQRRASCCGKFWRIIMSFIPILSWLPGYDYRHDAISDILTGCTIVALHIPQGLAYSQLAGLAPVNGLYVSLFPVIAYAIFGGSRQLSVGTFAVVCITCKDVLTSLSKDINIVDFDNFKSTPTRSDMESFTSVEVLTSLALLVGVILLIMGILRLGVLATLLSEPIISAFVVASSLYVLTSQIFDLIGIPSRYGQPVIPFELLNNWYQFCAHIHIANIYTIALSIVTVLALLTSKHFLEPFIQRTFNLKHFALPAELLAIIVVTLASSVFHFDSNFKIVVIPKLNAGFGHMPVTPIVSLWSHGSLITGAFVIAFIVYATSFTLAKLFADNHGYRVNANQELLALGTANIVGSFFLCFPASGSLARSAVQEKVGGKTQLASLFSAGFLVLFLLFLSGYLETLPKSTLASIILVALLNTLKKFHDVLRFWNISKMDGFLWIVTFILVVLFGVGNGLLYALVFNLAVLIIRMAIPKFSVRKPILNSDCYYSYSGKVQNDNIHHGAIVFEFYGSLMHLSVEHFRRQFRTKILVPLRRQRNNCVKFVIFDSHAVSYIDGKGVEILRETRDILRKLGNIELLLASCNGSVYDTLHKCSYFDGLEGNRKVLFATTIDAVAWARMHESNL